MDDRDEPRSVARRWVERNPQREGESVREWRQRFMDDTEQLRRDRANVRTYERRLKLSMLARGALASYLLGLMLTLGRLDPREWSWFAFLCAACFLIGWIVTMSVERKA